MLAMKVAAILLLSTILVQERHVKKREALPHFFALMVQKHISEEHFKALCDLTKQMQTILTESKNEEDQKVIQKSLEILKEAIHHLVIATLATTTEIADATLENEEVTEIMTNSTQIEDGTEPESMCDDREVDYKVEDEIRKEFTQVLVEVSVEYTTCYQPKVIALFSLIGLCGVVLIGLLVFTVVKMISCLF